MQESLRRKAAKKFAEKWQGQGSEKQQSQKFWMELLHGVYGVNEPGDYISFESKVKLSHTSFIDAYIDETRVMIEQKSIDKDLTKPIPQSDGTTLTPIAQAKRYLLELPVSKHPRWVIVCNFREFDIYDMEQPQKPAEIVLLENLEHEYPRLQFLVDNNNEHINREMEISIQAGQLVGKLYEAFLEEYINPDDPETLRSLNVLCVRLVFCLYAEDAGLFGRNHSAFYDYMRQFPPKLMRRALLRLFKVLNTAPNDRDPYEMQEDPMLANFPYCAGGLFHEMHIEIPNITDKIADLLLERASEGFDWAEISPTIFGAVFESTLNPDTRRTGGMHYTSVENIHKVIDPLFMDELNEEFLNVKEIQIEKQRRQQLMKFQDKLASIHFLDPACGSGNFLTETYLSLRRLENEVIKELSHGQSYLAFDDYNPIKVDIKQFYGIEINDFAVTVAATALWIAEAQMMAETERIINLELEYFPLKSYENIHEANALRIDWNDVCPKEKLDYIIGNPPFVGKSFQSQSQKQDMNSVFDGVKNYGNLDYVTCWYKKSVDYIEGTSCQVAFVSTNSICQGIAVPPFWNWFNMKCATINFAYPSFVWNSESTQKAAVHCVIVGFSFENRIEKKLYMADGKCKVVKNINNYLLDAPSIIIDDIHDPICDVPKTSVGSFPTDGGNLVVSADEYYDFLSKEPLAQPFIRPFIGPYEFINRKNRYCLWLKECSPSILRKMPYVLDRIRKVREFRLSSSKKQTQKRADTPSLFAEDRQPDKSYILFPRTSSERRKYLPIGFISPETIAGDTIILPDATMYHFGVLTSVLHNAWMRQFCGRMKSDYRYSGTLVYNTFPWPTPTDKQKEKIEQTAQAILDARNLYPDCSLADLYDEVTMPPELRKAHQQNDRAVIEAYGFPKDIDESTIVARLLEMYKTLYV